MIGNPSSTIEYLNEKGMDAFGNVLGKRCHKILRNLDERCKDCVFLSNAISMKDIVLRYQTKDSKGQNIEIVETWMPSDPEHWMALGRATDAFPIGGINYKALADAMDAMGDGVTVVDLNGRIVYANKAHEKLHGYPLNELVGSDISIFYPPESKEDSAKEVIEGVRAGGWGGIIINSRKDGSRFWVSLKTAPLRDSGGEVVGFIGIARDVSEAESTREKLQGEVVDLEKHLESEMVELSRRFDQLRIIQELGRSMVTSSSEEEIAMSAASALVDVMGYAAVGIALVSDSDDKRTLQLIGSRTKIAPGKYGQKINEAPVNKSIRKGAAIIESYPEERLSVGLMARSELIVPLIQKERVFGALIIADQAESRFSPDDVSIGMTIADLVAVSLANCHSSRKMRDRENALNLLDDMTLQTTAKMDVSEILTKTASRINEILDTQACLIGMATSDGGIDWVTTHGANEFGQELTGKRFHDNLMRKVVKSGTVYYTNDYLSSPSTAIREGLNLLINSMLIAPIRLRDETIGVITLINKTSPGGFTEENAALVQNFSDHLAVLIHNAETMASLDFSLMTRNSLLRTTFDLQAATGVPDIHQKVGDMLLEVVPYDAARFYSIREKNVVPVHSRNLGEKVDLSVMESDILDIVAKTLAERKGWSGILICPEREGKPELQISLLVIPMMGREDEVGAIVIARLADQAFTDQDQEIVTLFANHAATALENALLLTREKEMLDESIQKVRQLESILDLTTSVMSVDRQEEAVKKVLQAMTSVLGFKKGAILKLAEREGELSCSQSIGFSPKEAEKLSILRLPISDLMSAMDGSGRLVGERTILLNERAISEHPIDEEKQAAARRVLSNLRLEATGDKFMITIEDDKGELVGVIILAEPADERRGKSKGVIDLLEIYGNLASIAINNARLFDFEISARAEVEQLNDLMTHDINNFIQGVLGYLDMISNDREVRERHRKYAERAIEQIESTKRLIENVRKLSWIKAGFPEKTMECDLGKVIGESLTYVMTTYPKKTVSFESTIDTGQYYVLGDEMIQELFINLFSNSVKFTPSQEVPIQLEVKTQAELGKEYWRIEVVDHGRGIPDDKKQFVFERFGKQDYTPYGFGLGLSICRNLARKYNGRIWVENRVPEDYRLGSKFIILLPKVRRKKPEMRGEGLARQKVVRKMKQKKSTGSSFSRVLKQPRPGQNGAGKAS